MGKPVPVYVTVDIAILVKEAEILLIRRKNDPFKGQWALPGGFLDPDEDLEEAARRELEEETGIRADKDRLSQVRAFGDPDRDPRGRTVSIAFYMIAARKPDIQAASDAEQAKWFALDSLPDLAFDHAQIIEWVLKSNRKNENPSQKIS